jgi:hypothetical protein
MYFEDEGAAIPAIVQPPHDGDNAQHLGQIRSSQFSGFGAVSPKVWVLREFKLQRDGPIGGACKLVVAPRGRYRSPDLTPVR